MPLAKSNLKAPGKSLKIIYFINLLATDVALVNVASAFFPISDYFFPSLHLKNLTFLFKRQSQHIVHSESIS